MKKEVSNADKQKALYLAGGITGGLILIALLLSFSFDYGVDSPQTSSLPDALKSALAADRAGLLQADALRSLGFLVVAFGMLWFYLKKGFKPLYLAVGIGLLAVVDMVGVSSRFLTKEDYVEKRQMANVTAPTAADQQILTDKE